MKGSLIHYILSSILIIYLIVSISGLAYATPTPNDDAKILVIKSLVKDDALSTINNVVQYLNREYGYNISTSKFSVEELVVKVFDIDKMKLESMCIGYKLSYTETYRFNETLSVERTYLFYIDVDTIKFTLIESRGSINLDKGLSDEKAKYIADLVLDDLLVIEGVSMDDVNLEFVGVIDASKEYVNGTWITLSKIVLYRLYISGILVNTYHVTVSNSGVVVGFAIPFIRVVDIETIHCTPNNPEAILASAVKNTPDGVTRDIVVNALNDKSKTIYYNGTSYTRLYSSSLEQLMLVPTHIYYIRDSNVWRINVIVDGNGEYIIGTVSSSTAIGLDSKEQSLGLKINSEEVSNYLIEEKDTIYKHYIIAVSIIALTLLSTYIVYRHTRSR